MFDNHFKNCLSSYGRTNYQVEFSKSIWSSTYKARQDESIDHTFYRVASTVASIEENKEEWTERFYDLFTNFKACPGGRILSNAGAKWDGTSWFNCFVGTKPDVDQDSIEGIYQTLIAQAKTLKSEGGWGMNFSFIRPRGAFIHGIGSESPGAVKFMELFDKSSEIITEGSGVTSKNKKGKEKIRKGAQMSTLDCWHPDVEEFITAKQTEGRLTKFNMSVGITEGFMAAVKNDLDWNLQFKGKV
jgi:ribonucleoside-diphosphate reductase alpha chain